MRSVFWYNVETQPEYGNLEVYGGRKRKFKYHAPENFSGLVEIEVSATDDKGATGSRTLITFNISGELGADIGLNAESSHISFQTLEKITLDISRRLRLALYFKSIIIGLMIYTIFFVL